jgi:ORF6N domain
MQRLLPAPPAAIAGDRAMIAPARRRLAPIDRIAQRIFVIRGQEVMLDTSLAVLYRVPTFRLNEAVKRNLTRFPANFMFQLVKEEANSLTSQSAMSKAGRGGRRTLPYAFMENTQKDHSAILTIVVEDIQHLGKKVMKKIKSLAAPRRGKLSIGFIAEQR